MDLKDLEGLLNLGLNPEFARKVEGALREVQAGKLPDFVDPSKQREKLLAGMRERLRGLRLEREESNHRFDVAIRNQEEEISILEREMVTPPTGPGAPDDRPVPTLEETPAEPVERGAPVRTGRKRKGKPGEQ